MRRLVPCLLVALLLIPTLTSQSLWWDEGISLHLASLSWQEIIRDRAGNIHPPLYFLLLKAWTVLAGGSPFAARYLSVLPTVLLPAAVHRFSRRCWGRQIGRAAAFLVAFAPPFLIYGQEVRAYAFLPLFWVILLDLSWPNADLSHWRIRSLKLAVLESVFILFHYAGFIAIALVDFLLLYGSLRAESKTQARKLRLIGVVSTASAAVLLLPWLLQTACLGFQGVGDQAGLSNALAEPVSGRFVLTLLAVFHGLGLPQALSNIALTRPLMLTGVSLVAGLGPLILSSRSRWVTLQMIVVWMLPFAVAPVIWMLSPQAHPRYLLPFILPAWLLVGDVVGRSKAPQLVRGGLLASTLVMSMLGLHAYFRDPTYARSDVRSVASYLRRRAEAGDVVLLPHTDWSLLQYDLGEVTPVMMPEPSDDTQVLATMRTAANPGHHVYLLDYERGAVDPRDQVRAYLVSDGYLVDRQQFRGVFLERYYLSQPIEALVCEPVGLCLDAYPLCLNGAALSDAPVSGGAVAVRLCWEGRAAHSLRAAMRLSASSDALVASYDELLIDTQVRPTDLWDGESTSTYHVVPLPVGIPPVAHRLTLGLYETGSVDIVANWSAERGSLPSIQLGSVEPAVEPWVERSLYGLPNPPQQPSIQVDPGIELVGAHIDRERLYAGQRFFTAVHWSLTKKLSVTVNANLTLVQDSQSLARTLLGSGLSALPPGRPLVEHVSLRVPAGAESGSISVDLDVDGQMVSLGTIDVLAGDHTFIMPSVPNAMDAQVSGVGRLVGFSRTPPGSIESGHPLTLTLFWQGTDESQNADLTVFTHLVSSAGEIVAQHDGKPAGGTRPTPSWLDGEFITDTHVLQWLDSYQGTATLRVGLYQATTGQRQPWASGRDSLDLPGALLVTFESGN